MAAYNLGAHEQAAVSGGYFTVPAEGYPGRPDWAPGSRQWIPAGSPSPSQLYGPEFTRRYGQQQHWNPETGQITPTSGGGYGGQPDLGGGGGGSRGETGGGYSATAQEILDRMRRNNRDPLFPTGPITRGGVPQARTPQTPTTTAPVVPPPTPPPVDRSTSTKRPTNWGGIAQWAVPVALGVGSYLASRRSRASQNPDALSGLSSAQQQILDSVLQSESRRRELSEPLYKQTVGGIGQLLPHFTQPTT